MKEQLLKFLKRAGIGIEDLIRGAPREINVGNLDPFIIREGGMLGNNGLTSRVTNEIKANPIKTGASAISGLGGAAYLMGDQGQEAIDKLKRRFKDLY